MQPVYRRQHLNLISTDWRGFNLSATWDLRSSAGCSPRRRTVFTEWPSAATKKENMGSIYTTFQLSHLLFLPDHHSDLHDATINHQFSTDAASSHVPLQLHLSAINKATNRLFIQHHNKTISLRFGWREIMWWSGFNVIITSMWERRASSTHSIRAKTGRPDAQAMYIVEAAAELGGVNLMDVAPDTNVFWSSASVFPTWDLANPISDAEVLCSIFVPACTANLKKNDASFVTNDDVKGTCHGIRQTVHLHLSNRKCCGHGPLSTSLRNKK